MPDLNEDTLVVILGGGQGNRLFPLTKTRAKPAVPLAGRYRLIDIPVSNALHSKLNRIFVLTQFNSASLNHHIARTYNFDSFTTGFVDVLAAEQTPGSSDWFQGTADAVRQIFPHLAHQPWKYLVILSGDHLYRMDYRHMLQSHIECEAEITVGVVPIGEERCGEFGLLKVNGAHEITDFLEKPPAEALEPFRTDTAALGLDPARAGSCPFLGSMGIYVFNRETVQQTLFKDPSMTDFGKHIIPLSLQSHKVSAYLYDGYWEDIGTIQSYFDANLQLCHLHSPFALFHPTHPIYTRQRHLAGSVILDGHISNSIVNEGCLVKEATIKNSVIGLRARIEPGASVESSLVLGADFYPEHITRETGIGIGRNTKIHRAIIDKNAHIGPNVSIINAQGLTEYDDPDGQYYIRNGIVIVTKWANIAEGTVI
ncbi:MAG: glucose-1-phosphate adenylyltransferase [Gammaproteobacteria bacterium]|nr:glucose-1-phosphate adenylyltransferase [Gammaproteobacteria bacterium]